MAIVIFVLILAVIGCCSWFLSRATYRAQVKNNYKNPYLTSTIVFILSFAILAAGVFFLIISNINFTR
ncbi:MAG TPA: hypothetical protein VGO58_20270 [Chitinophagaceae bacterium]|jgi:hypothetical protein|nr:hypothetical protein [Chitinophagaceae bacterium]